MPFINSTNILVYPSAYRGYTTSSPTTQYNPEAKLNSEYNITTLNYKIAKRSFVITPSFSAGGSLEFSIYGYYFKIKALAAASIPTLAGDSSATQLWAGIKVKALNTGSDAGNTSYPGYSLVNCDNEQTPLDTNDGTEDKFGGVLFNKDSNFSTTVTDKVCLLVKSGSTWVIPAASKLKVILSDIKGGTLDGVEKGLDEYLNTGRIDAANINVSSTIVNDGTTTLKGDTEVGTSSVNKTLKVHGAIKLQDGSTDKFTIDSSGNVVAKGTASIDGNTAVKGTFTVGTSSAKKATTLNGTLTVTGDSAITSTTESSSTSTGALKVSGGVGIAKKLNVGGNTSIGGTLDVASGKKTTLGGALQVDDVSNFNSNVNINNAEFKIRDEDGNIKLGIDSFGNVNSTGSASFDDEVKAGTQLKAENGELHLKNRVTNSSSYTVLKSGTQNTAREIALPNASGTVALKDINNEFSAKQDFNAGIKLKSDQTFEIGGTTYTISGSGDSKFKDIDFTGTLKVNGGSTYSIGNTGNATLNQVYAKGGLFIDDGSTKKNINNVFGASLSGSGTDTIQLLDKSGANLKTITINNVGHATAADSATSATNSTYAQKIGSSSSSTTIGTSSRPVYVSNGYIVAGAKTLYQYHSSSSDALNIIYKTGTLNTGDTKLPGQQSYTLDSTGLRVKNVNYSGITELVYETGAWVGASSCGFTIQNKDYNEFTIPCSIWKIDLDDLNSSGWAFRAESGYIDVMYRTMAKTTSSGTTRYNPKIWCIDNEIYIFFPGSYANVYCVNVILQGTVNY